MNFRQPEIFLIAQSRPNNSAIQKWLEYVGCTPDTVTKYSSGSEAAAKTSGERIVELAGRRCYLSFEVGLNPNVQKIRTDIVEYITNVLKSGHGSVLEHVDYTFAIEGVSRVFTGEMNRHRAGVAISEGSMRFIAYNDIPLTETPMLTMGTDTDDPVLTEKKQRTRDAFRECAQVIEYYYNILKDEVWREELKPESKFKDKKHITSLLRRIIPMGVATGGIWTGNLRALRHICTMRCSEAAEEEILCVATKILRCMMEEEPTFFGDFTQDDKGFWGPTYNKV